MRIALLPLDDRPVNTALPAQTAAIAGADLVTPPADLLPRMRSAGRADELARWLERVSGEADALVVSLDMLGYGGLIASRTSHDPAEAVVERLAVLHRIRARRPRLPISAVTTVMRASRSYSPAEEPEYWPRHGVELHDLGGALHRQFLGEPHRRADLEAEVPAPVRADFLGRRLRNHTADLYALDLAARCTVHPLLITADDTAPRSAGSLEQLWLRQWVSAAGLDNRVLMYPGADEVGAVLVSRALGAGLERPVRIAVVIPDEAGASRIAPYENVPVGEGVARQIRAAGAVPAGDVDDCDAVLVVHAPHAQPGDWAGAPPADPVDDAVTAVADRVALLVKDGHAVGVADVRHANGGDPALVRRLARDHLLDEVRAYGGWNTAGNTIGSVVAALVAHVAGERRGTADPDAERRLRWHRILEDFGYQTVVRTELAEQVPEYRDHMSVPFDDAATIERYLGACADRLSALASDLGGRDWTIDGLRLPWRRTFEIDFDLVAAS